MPKHMLRIAPGAISTCNQPVDLDRQRHRVIAEVVRVSAGAEAEFVAVAGALEIPLALQWMAQSGRFDALAAIGAVIRGDTYHFEVVANESARGLMDVALETGLPVANGILTVDTEAQALARKDKGAEAVRVALEMARLRQDLTLRWR